MNHSPPIQNVLQFFAYDHLKGKLRSTSFEFHELAHNIADSMPDSMEPNPELVVALRKLLEAKDAAVRARLWKAPS